MTGNFFSLAVWKIFPAMAADITDVTDESLGTDVQESVSEVTSQATEEVNQVVRYFEDHIPDIIAFGLKVVFALIFFFVGSKLINWLRKIVRKSFERTGTDAGVSQFIDSMLKFGLYAILIFIIATKFG